MSTDDSIKGMRKKARKITLVGCIWSLIDIIIVSILGLYLFIMNPFSVIFIIGIITMIIGLITNIIGLYLANKNRLLGRIILTLGAILGIIGIINIIIINGLYFTGINLLLSWIMPIFITILGGANLYSLDGARTFFLIVKIEKLNDIFKYYPKGEPILKIRKIYHYYGKAKSIEEVNLDVKPQALDGVIGPNGAGKTTLLRCLSGLEEIDRGKIFYYGMRIDEMDAYKIARLRIAQCPERRKLFYDMTVLENLEMGAFHLQNKIRRTELLNYVFTIFPRLKERRKQRAGTLSGGEQQMLALGRALMADPQLLLLDEPSIGLAPKIKVDIMDAIQDIRDRGVTTLLVEQDAAIALDYAENINVLEEGKIEMRGTKEELEKEPRIKKVYLGL